MFSHRTLLVMGTRSYYTRLSPLFGYYPLSERVHESEALGGSRLYQQEDAIVSKPMPQGLYHHLPLLGVGHLLEYIAQYYNVKLAFLTTNARYHAE